MIDRPGLVYCLLDNQKILLHQIPMMWPLHRRNHILWKWRRHRATPFIQRILQVTAQFTIKKKKKKDTSGNVTHYETQSCLSKEYSSSHQTLKMFTLPKLILIPNSWSINTTVRSFACVYFSSYFAPAWNEHFVSNQIFQRCELQLRTFLSMDFLP